MEELRHCTVAVEQVHSSKREAGFCFVLGFRLGLGLLGRGWGTGPHPAPFREGQVLMLLLRALS